MVLLDVSIPEEGKFGKVRTGSHRDFTMTLLSIFMTIPDVVTFTMYSLPPSPELHPLALLQMPRVCLS